MTIIERLEAATGADREIDADLMVALCGAWRVNDSQFYGPGEKSWSFGEYEEESRAWCGPLPYLTASLDAALALVEEKLPGCDWNLDRDSGRYEFEILPTEERIGYGARSATPALAVLIALLRALEAKDRTHDPRS